MKALKISLYAILGLLVLLVVAVGIFSLPSVQRAVVTRLVATEPGESFEVDYFHVGFRQTEMRDVHFEQPDASYRVAELTADLSLFDLIFRRQLRIGDLIVTGLVVDLSEMEPAEEKEPFEGILGEMDLPMPLYLERLRAEGQLLLPGLAEQSMLGDFVVTGGGFAPGQEAELELVGDLQASGQPDFLAALGLEGSMTILQANGGRIERARLLALVSAAGTGVDPAETLSADVLLLATDDGEAYQARVGRVLTNQTEETDLSTLVVLDATYQHEEGLLEGRWELQVDREQLAAFVGDVELPAFDASGNGEFTYGLAGERLDAAGEIQVRIAGLETIAEELGELGGFGLSSSFNLAMDDAAFRLEELVVELRDEQEQNLLELRNFQAIHYDRQAERLQGVEEGIDLAQFTIHALPVEWANLFLQAQQGQPETVVRGGNVTGQLIVRAEGETIFFRLAEPLRADGIALLSGEEPLLSDVSFEARGSGSFQEGRLMATVEMLQFLHQQQTVLSGSGTFDSAAEEMEARLEADLPVLLNLPLLADYNNLSSGTLDLEIALTLGELRQIEINGGVRDLVTRDDQQALADLNFQALVNESAENIWEINLPVSLEAPVPSDLQMAGTLSTATEVSQVELNITGEHVNLEDLIGLASGFSAPEGTDASDAPGPGAPPPPADERDEEPVWAGVQGAVTMEIAEVRLQENYGLEELRGELTVAADSVVNTIRATFLESPVEMDARLRFLATEEQPYVLDGLLEAPNLPVGDLFRQFQPQRPPTVEGLFVASVEFEGTGRNVPDLIDGVRGEVRMRSGGGVIRLLNTDNPLAGVGAAATAILGTLGGEVGAISRVAGQLSNMPYNEMNLFAERDENLNFILQDFTVLSPELHLQGVGEVQHRENVPVLDQPMQITLAMGALGSLQETLGTLRVLGEETDELGYVQMRDDFVITGTPSDPNSSAFYRMLVDAVLRFVGPGEEDDEERPRGPQIPDIFDILGGSRGR